MAAEGPGRTLPFGVGAAAGAGAWVLGYLFAYLLTSTEIRESIVRQFAEIPVWKAVGWVFFNAHLVDTVFEGFFGGAENFVGGENGFTPLLYVVPPLLLVAAGLAVGRYAGVDDADAANAALAGVTTVAGYGVLSLVAVFLFASENGHGPEVVTGVLLAGVLYPAIFGAVGASVARLTGS